LKTIGSTFLFLKSRALLGPNLNHCCFLTRLGQERPVDAAIHLHRPTTHRPSFAKTFENPPPLLSLGERSRRSRPRNRPPQRPGNRSALLARFLAAFFTARHSSNSISATNTWSGKCSEAPLGAPQPPRNSGAEAGAVARNVESDIASLPRSGIAERMGFAPLPVPCPTPSEPMRSIATRFEDDLHTTWGCLAPLDHVYQSNRLASLHTHIIPPRSCWIERPSFAPGTPALGFF
jgi:hypothetical protein